MTPEEWKKIEAALDGAFGCATLLVDGYKLSLNVQRVGTRSYKIGFYVDGWFKGEWLANDCEERRRFCCARQSAVYTPSQRAKLTKGFSKKAIAQHFPGIDKKFTYYTSHWSSFSALKRHLVANNKSIELQECYP